VSAGADQREIASVGSLDELPDGIPVRVEVGEIPVCLVRLGDVVHAIGDTCSHQDVSLAEGEVDADDCTVECWKHGSAFSLRTGQPETLPATKPVPVYPVEVIDGEVVVTIRGGDDA
jgi:3-phenylpropionate/trans-cinnamate dioxygenase ferredoxin component